MLRIDPETVLVILTTTQIPGRISLTGTVLSGATFGASDTMTVVTGILAETDVTDRTRVDMARRGPFKFGSAFNLSNNRVNLTFYQ